MQELAEWQVLNLTVSVGVFIVSVLTSDSSDILSSLLFWELMGYDLLLQQPTINTVMYMLRFPALE